MTRLTLIALLVLSAGPGWAGGLDPQCPLTGGGCAHYPETYSELNAAPLNICNAGQVVIDGKCADIIIPNSIAQLISIPALKCPSGSILATIGHDVHVCAAIDTLTKPEGR